MFGGGKRAENATFEDLLMIVLGGGAEEIEIHPTLGIPMVADSGDGLTPAEKYLANDFDRLFEDCSLVKSTGVLPEAGGWNDQTNEFAKCWLIYYSERQRAESPSGPEGDAGG